MVALLPLALESFAAGFFLSADLPPFLASSFFPLAGAFLSFGADLDFASFLVAGSFLGLASFLPAAAFSAAAFFLL